MSGQAEKITNKGIESIIPIFGHPKDKIKISIKPFDKNKIAPDGWGKIIKSIFKCLERSRMLTLISKPNKTESDKDEIANYYKKQLKNYEEINEKR